MHDEAASEGFSEAVLQLFSQARFFSLSLDRIYNQSTAKTYEVETGPLTSDKAEWIDQLFSSHNVFRIEPEPTNSYDPFVLAPILITDPTCEIQNGDESSTKSLGYAEKLNKVKFTWRYEDNRPIVRLSASPGIFTEHFNPVYS